MKTNALLLAILCCVFYPFQNNTHTFSFTNLSFSNSKTTKNNADDFISSRQKLDKTVLDEMIKQNLPGVAVGVIDGNRIIHAKGYGYTNIEKKTKVTENTIFRWASISKPLTAVAALQLAERNSNFKLKDEVHKHFDNWFTPSQHAQKSKVTIEHLLKNKSGISKYGKGRDGKKKNPIYDRRNYRTESDGFNGSAAAAVFRHEKLDFNPGANYLYSTFGFNLLGAVIDQYHSKGYVEYVKKNIADELGMGSLRVARTNRNGYEKDCDGILNTKGIGNIEWKLPGGGWESNIKDLAKFARGILKGDLLEDKDKLWSRPTNVGTEYYHYGVKLKRTNSIFKVWHGGAHENIRTLLMLYPNENKAIVIMCYAEYADCHRLANLIYDNVFDNKNKTRSPLDKCNSKMESCNGKFTGIWRKTNSDVILRRGYSHKAFYNEWDFLRDQGYYCTNFEVNFENGKHIWDGIFKKGTGSQSMWRGFDFAGFKKKWDEEIAKGNHLIDLERYTQNGVERWAGLFRKGKEKTAMYRNLSNDDFKKKRSEMAKSGRKLIDIEVRKKGGKLYWSGVWREGKDGLLIRNYTKDNFGKYRQEKRKQGYKLIDIEVYRHNGKEKWAGVWEKNNQDEKLHRNYDFCNLMEKHADYSKVKYELIDLEKVYQ